MVKNLKGTKKILEIISLSNPKLRIFTFLIILFLLFIIPLDFLNALPNLSLCSQILGKFCYSIGLTRGVSCLLKGDFYCGADYNLLSIPVLITMILIIIADFFKIKRLK